MKIREWCFIIQVAELFIKIFVLIIPNLYYPIFNPESVAKVLVIIMMINFYIPVFNVFTIEKRYPTLVCCCGSFGGLTGTTMQYHHDDCQCKKIFHDMEFRYSNCSVLNAKEQ